MADRYNIPSVKEFIKGTFTVILGVVFFFVITYVMEIFLANFSEVLVKFIGVFE